tara:strand:- start:408 stop:932 length:525 start_codon:yes stop_codon:yes gene_type:complete
MSPTVIDNYISFHSFQTLKKGFMGSQFPWFYNPHTLTREGDHIDEDKESYQFVNLLYKQNHGPQSEGYNYIIPILQRLYTPNVLIRAKANLNPRDVKHSMIGGYHTDHPFKHAKTAIYYVNTNNGWTEFETGEVIPSVENRIVIFDSKIKHVGYSCTDEKTRVVLNINYLPLNS